MKTPRRSTRKSAKAGNSTPTTSRSDATSRFEVFLGGTWQAFEGVVTKTKDAVTVTRDVTPQDGKAFKLTTTFNLNQLPAYSFA